MVKESGANTRTPVSIVNQELSDWDARTQLTRVVVHSPYETNNLAWNPESGQQ